MLQNIAVMEEHRRYISNDVSLLAIKNGPAGCVVPSHVLYGNTQRTTQI